MAEQILNPAEFPFYKPNDPYYYEVDNVPLEHLWENQKRLQAQIDEFPLFSMVATKQWVEDNFVDNVTYTERSLTDISDVDAPFPTDGDMLGFDAANNAWTDFKYHNLPFGATITNPVEGDLIHSDGVAWTNRAFNLAFDIADFPDVRLNLNPQGGAGSPAGLFLTSSLEGVVEVVMHAPVMDSKRMWFLSLTKWLIQGGGDPHAGYGTTPPNPVATQNFVLDNVVNVLTVRSEIDRLWALIDADPGVNPTFDVSDPFDSDKTLILETSNLVENSVPQDLVFKVGSAVVNTRTEGSPANYSYAKPFTKSYAAYYSTIATSYNYHNYFHIGRNNSTFEPWGTTYRNEHLASGDFGYIKLSIWNIGSQDKT